MTLEPGLIVVLCLAGVAVNAAILYFMVRLAVTHALTSVLNRVNLDKLRGAEVKNDHPPQAATP